MLRQEGLIGETFAPELRFDASRLDVRLCKLPGIRIPAAEQFRLLKGTPCADVTTVNCLGLGEERKLSLAMEHRMGFEPMNTGFADQRVSHFAIGASARNALRVPGNMEKPTRLESGWV